MLIPSSSSSFICSICQGGWNVRFLLRPHYRQQRVIVHRPTKFHLNWTTSGRVMTSYRFSKRRPHHHNSTSGFVFGDVPRLRRSRSIWRRNFDEVSESMAKILLIPVSRKKTTAILDIYFHFRFLPLRHHRHIILHQPIKCHPNRTICGRVMTSSDFQRRGRKLHYVGFAEG